jgi:putative DNA primase/helicase
VVKVRILGHSKQVQVDTRGTLVFATGNQLSLIGDICRRTVLSSLDPKLERPELRQFRSNPIAKIQANRGRYVADCLIIVRAYILAGRPNPAPKLASFEGWSDTERSALIWLGEADPVQSMEVTRAEDPERAELRSMMDAWTKEFGIGSYHRTTVAALIEAAMEVVSGSLTKEPEHPELQAACTAACYATTLRRGPPDVTSLGIWLRNHKGRVIDGKRFMNQPNPKGASTWWIEEVVTEQQAGDQSKQKPAAHHQPAQDQVQPEVKSKTPRF